MELADHEDFSFSSSLGNKCQDLPKLLWYRHLAPDQRQNQLAHCLAEI